MITLVSEPLKTNQQAGLTFPKRPYALKKLQFLSRLQMPDIESLIAISCETDPKNLVNKVLVLCGKDFQNTGSVLTGCIDPFALKDMKRALILYVRAKWMLYRLDEAGYPDCSVNPKIIFVKRELVESCQEVGTNVVKGLRLSPAWERLTKKGAVEKFKDINVTNGSIEAKRNRVIGFYNKITNPNKNVEEPIRVPKIIVTRETAEQVHEGNKRMPIIVGILANRFPESNEKDRVYLATLMNSAIKAKRCRQAVVWSDIEKLPWDKLMSTYKVDSPEVAALKLKTVFLGSETNEKKIVSNVNARLREIAGLAKRQQISSKEAFSLTSEVLKKGRNKIK